MSRKDYTYSSAAWHETLAALEGFVTTAQEEDSWAPPGALTKAYRTICKTLDADLAGLESYGPALLAPDGDVEKSTKKNEEVLRLWHLKEAPSLTAMVIYAAQNLGLSLSPDIRQLVLIGSILGEVENPLPYHNNMHYRKVTLQLLRMIAVHRDLYQGTKCDLSDEQAALMIFTACVHDLGHDGTGNMRKGVFTQSRLELRSIEILQPFFAQLGLHGDPRARAIETMILCTDVTPFNDPGNPAGQLRAAYRFHFLGDKDKVDSLHLDKNLVILQKDEQLTQMAMMLHEADIATSAGLTYAVTKYETAILREEVGDDEGQPHHVVNFIDKVCGRQMLSAAAQKLYASNMTRIHARAEADMNDGDELYPCAELSEFLLASPLGEQTGISQTLN